MKKVIKSYKVLNLEIGILVDTLILNYLIKMFNSSVNDWNDLFQTIFTRLSFPEKC